MVSLQNWKNQARVHWKEFQPKRFKALTKAGKLDAALQGAANQTLREMTDLEAKGYNHQEAWEIVRESYLFPPEEGTKLRHSDSPMWAASEPVTLRELMQSAAKSGARTMEIPQPPKVPRNAQEFKDALKGELK